MNYHAKYVGQGHFVKTLLFRDQGANTGVTGPIALKK